MTNSFSTQTIGAYHNPTTQESSSQSSSADNGDPHTPSPQYSESIVNHPTNGHVIAAHAEGGVSKTLATTMDPNLARLLNSLSMSAAISIDDKDNAKLNLTPLSVRPVPPVSTTPVPVTVSPIAPPLPQRSEPVDWSSHVPKPLSERPADMLQAPSSSCHGSTSMGTRPLPDSAQSSSRHHQPPPALSFSPYPNGTDTPSDFHQGPPTPPSAAPSAASISSVASSTTSSRNMSSRRTSSTADISPYLSRSTEMPTSGKRLKQLALLETVADESAKMTPQTGNREQNSRPRGPQNGPQGYQLPMSGRYPYAPQPPSSTLPSSINNDMNDLRVIYSSGHGPAPMQPGLPHHSQTHHAPPLNYDDPFQVRPRTSQALHPNSTYPGHPFAGRSASMHQNQLLSLLAGPGPQRPHLHTPPPLPPVPQLISPYPHPIFGPPPPHPHVLQHSMPARGSLPPLQVTPHNLYPPQGQYVPASAPALSPTFDLPPPLNNIPPNNMDLLSILNGTKSVTTGRASTSNMTAPPSALHR
jgi:mRNA-decapping enzyme subunit 2